MPDISDLRQRQALPLRAKVLMSQNRIREWYDYWNGDVYVSFSGGKDSTVLAHLVHDIYPDVPLVFANTGLEFPEIQSFARKMGAEFVRPQMQFSEVISTYGYPIISKVVAEAIYKARAITYGQEKRKWTDDKRGELHGEMIYIKNNDGKNVKIPWRRKALLGVDELSKEHHSIFNKEKWLPLCQETNFKISERCCNYMKKSPLKKYQQKTKLYPYLGTLAEESQLREQAWIKHGCNAFEGKKKTSQPMSFWLEHDVLQYIKDNNLEIASVYGDIVTVDSDGMEYDNLLAPCGELKCSGCQRTGCIFCGFGAHLDKEPRFVRLAKTHPKQYEYCMNGGQWVDNPKYDPVAPKYDGDWLNWNPKKIWVPSKKGLGMKKVFDDCNQIYGKDFIRYE